MVQRMMDFSGGRRVRLALSILFAVACCASPARVAANGFDLPADITIQGFAKVEAGEGHLLVRMPLALLPNAPLPKRGPGYLDLAHIDAGLKQAAVLTERQIELRSGASIIAPSV